MLDAFSQVNWLGVAVGTIAFAVLGGLWFGLLVRRRYLSVLGRDSAPAPTLLTNVGPLVCVLAVVLASAVLVAALGLGGAADLADAVVLGLVIGVGFLAAMTFQIAINPNFPHPIRYGLLNAPYFVVGSLVSCVALVLV